MRKHVRALSRWLVRLVVGAVLVVLTVLVVEAFVARDMIALQAWHHTVPDDFRARDDRDGFSFADYMQIEDRLFANLGTYDIAPDNPQGLSSFSRYMEGGTAHPLDFDTNWNRSIELVPDEIRGGVLLLHGLSDSPYSMRSMAELFHAHGFYTLSMRLPGHGTVPAGLLKVHWEDWAAAVRPAAQHVRQRAGAGTPFYLCGYSNGGALSVLYTLEALEQPGLAVPDRLFLFSPAIGITDLAAASNWHRILSWMPYFEKSRWLSIEPEYDPYKYNSFTKNAAAQCWDLTREVQRRLERLTDEGRLHDMPPVLAFQSLVDATVVMEELVSRLFDRLEPNGSNLVLFDVNRTARVAAFLRNDKAAFLAQLENRDDRPYELTVVTNVDDQSPAVEARTLGSGARITAAEPLGLSWPLRVYSLAHVAIPFPEHDPLYGAVADEADPDRLHLGALAPRGERDVLRVSAADLLRLRHNPFHAYMLRRMTTSITDDLEH